VAIVISIVLGTGEIASVAIVLVFMFIYIFAGGMVVVIWTDVV